MWSKHVSVPISLIETILVLPNNIPLLREHLFRIQESIQQLGWPLQTHFIKNIQKELIHFAKETPTELVYKLEWSFSGYQYFYTWSQRHTPQKEELLSWHLKPHTIYYNTHSLTRNLKLTSRSRYQHALNQHQKSKDLLLINQHGFLTESTIANLFFKIDNQWLTPCLSTGCVNGVFRRHFIKEELIQPILFPIDQINIIDKIYLGNAIRGLWEVDIYK